MLKLEKLPKGGVSTRFSILDYKVFDFKGEKWLIPFMRPDQYIEIMTPNYKWVTDDEGNREEIHKGYKMIYCQYEQRDFLSEKGDWFEPPTQADWRTYTITFKGIDYHYCCEKINTHSYHIEQGLDYFTKDRLSFSYKNLIWQGYHKIDYSKFPFLEYMCNDDYGDCYYRIVDHREALTKPHKKGSLLDISTKKFKRSMTAKVNLMVKSIERYRDLKPYKLEQLIIKELQSQR